ncbi:hypothetical protein [Cytobacillus solani]|uniref:Uncharacterized protein n=1 Tax=Cytobacillus solani TaxID=1637975 RepID=A0A0Q3QMZ5_9BACI|nr:hypothetical protein [Cytobacillus solani]KQL19094.1 hypothetical protein AN957_11210 [Cytobacillus solani]
MKLNRYPRPTEHYDKQLHQVDEQICALLKQRKELSNNNRINRRNNNTFELFISKQYDCWLKRAGGSIGHLTYHFIVSPTLPDDISEIDLVFKEYSDTIKDKPTGLEIVMNLE